MSVKCIIGANNQSASIKSGIDQHIFQGSVNISHHLRLFYLFTIAWCTIRSSVTSLIYDTF